MTELRKFLWVALVLPSVLVTPLSPAMAQRKDKDFEAPTRKVISKVAPVYPPLARQAHLTGIVKLVAVVTPEGAVKRVRTVGGNPVLAAAAEDAVRHWKYEVAKQESSEAVALRFSPEK